MKKLIYLLPFVLAFSCQQKNGAEQAAATEVAGKAAAMDKNLQQLFEEVNVVKMHLYATQEAQPTAENYPYTGKPIEGSLVQYLDENIQPSEIGGVYACYHLENNDSYILRVPGKYVSGDLALVKWDAAAGKLRLVQDLAYIQCDEGLCHQQDAWLTDLDDNRSLELVTRSSESDMGKVIREDFNVLTPDAQGMFVKSDEKLASLAPKENYVLWVRGK